MFSTKYVGLLFLCIGLSIGAGTVLLLHKKTATKMKESTQIKTPKTFDDELMGLLQEAFADEWLAYYQYWMGAIVIKKTSSSQEINLEKVTFELKQHADDEVRHAKMLAKRIIELGGTPLLEPQQWYKHTGCGYLIPRDPAAATIIEQNIKGEICAIDFYKKLILVTKEKDEITYKIAKEILADELEHKEDLEELLPEKEKKE